MYRSFFERATGKLVAALICLVAFLLMVGASSRDSLITDELAHIPAGYGYVKHLDFRLNPEHPPLLKALSAAPLLLLNPHFPVSSPAWTTAVNGQWDMGTQFIYESGNDADQIVNWSRLGPILITILLIVLVYAWSAELLGWIWGILPALLLGLSPNFLAHGHYVTTDVVAAFGTVLATRYFLQYLYHPSRKSLLFAGLAFGVAQAGKFSAVLLIPFFLFLVFVFYILSVRRDWWATMPPVRLKRFGIRALHYATGTFLVFAAGYLLVIYPLYAVFTVNYPLERQVSDTEFILATYGKGPTAPGATCIPSRCLADLNIYLAKNDVTRPMAHYMLGVLMVIQRAAGGNTAYFLGEVTNVGSRLYFPVVYLLKEPLPVLLLLFIGLGVAIGRMVRSIHGGFREVANKFLSWLERNFTVFALAFFVVFYWAYSMRSPLNIGFRHLFPTLPFIYMLIAVGWKRWITELKWAQGESSIQLFVSWMKLAMGSVLKYKLLVALVLWFVIETFVAAPHFLSYFNQLGGGVWGGYRYVTDSNYDWGQDMLALRDFVRDHPEIDRIAIDHFGGAKASYYLGDKAVSWWSAKGNPMNEGIRWFAISSNSLQGSIHPTAYGFTRPERDEYRWLTELRPGARSWDVPPADYRVGTAIFIYKLDQR